MCTRGPHHVEVETGLLTALTTRTRIKCQVHAFPSQKVTNNIAGARRALTMTEVKEDDYDQGDEVV